MFSRRTPGRSRPSRTTSLPTPARKIPPCRLDLERLEERFAPAILGSPNQNFVNQLYQDLLNRPVEPSGLAFWSTMLDQGTGRPQVITGIQNSVEYRTVQVARLYNTILGRDPDAMGLQGWVSFLGQGGQPEQVALQMLASPEFFQNNGNDNDRFMDNVFDVLLDESIDPAGREKAITSWDQVLAGGVSRLTVVTAIFNGTQSLQRQVNLEYLRLLGRPADSGGLDAFVTVERQAGMNVVINGITRSAEYFNRAQTNPVQLPGTTVTTLNLAPSAASAGLNQPVTFTAVVLPNTIGPFSAGGTVAFNDGNTLLATVAVTNGGASFTTTTLTAGAHTISASYSGDANFSSSAAMINFTVGTVPTAVAVTSLTGTANLTQMVTFQATVTPSTVGTFVASGSVTFLDGTTPLGTRPLSGGMATLSTTALAAGNHQITASYSGDASFAASSGIVMETINPVSTSAVLISSAPSANPGQGVTFTINLSPVAAGSFMATGTVTFTDGNVVLASLPVGNGTVAFMTSVLAPGSHTIAALYGGDTNFTMSSAVFTQTINATPKSTTMLALASSVNPANLNETVTLTATITSTNATPATGTVTFMDRGTLLGSAPVNGNVAALPVSSLAAGSHWLVATYGGDTTFNASTATLTQVITQQTLTITLGASASTTVFGQLPTFTATISTTTPNAGTPTGSVAFLDGDTVLGTSPVQTSNGQILAQFTPSMPFTVGTHAITAVYQGDSTFASTTSTALNETVNRAATATATPTSSLNPATFGQTVTFTAVVSVTAPGTGTPTGSVNFLDGGTLLGNRPLALVNGAYQASFTTATLLNAGPHSISAVYSGDGNFAGSTSTVLTQTVNAQTPTLSITASPQQTMNGFLITGGKPNVNVLIAASSQAGSPTPTGRVSLTVDGVSQGASQPLSGGSFTFTVLGLSTGTAHTLAVTYFPGNGNFAMTSRSVSYTVHFSDADSSPPFTDDSGGQDTDNLNNATSDDMFF